MGVILSKEIANDNKTKNNNEKKIFEIDQTLFNLDDEIAKENNNDKINNINILKNSSDNSNKQNNSNLTILLNFS